MKPDRVQVAHLKQDLCSKREKKKKKRKKVCVCERLSLTVSLSYTEHFSRKKKTRDYSEFITLVVYSFKDCMYTHKHINTYIEQKKIISNSYTIKLK